jgi:putative endonuclease
MPRTTAPIKDPAPTTPERHKFSATARAGPLVAPFQTETNAKLSSSGLTRGPNYRLNTRMAYYAYMPASRPRGTLYIGVTGDLVRRVWEHRSGAVPGFTRRYGVDRLVWFEVFNDASAAIQREKTLKQWLRAWKIALIERNNPNWRDLYNDIANDQHGSSGQARGRQEFTSTGPLRAN